MTDHDDSRNTSDGDVVRLDAKRDTSARFDKREQSADRDASGRFRPGHRQAGPGRPAGSRNRATEAAQSLLDGQTEALTAKAVELALDGDTTALRLCLERLLPPRKDRPVSLSLPPMDSAQDVARAAAAVTAAVAEGTLTPVEGQAVASLIEGHRKALETADLAERLARLERATQGGTE